MSSEDSSDEEPETIRPTSVWDGHYTVSSGDIYATKTIQGIHATSRIQSKKDYDRERFKARVEKEEKMLAQFSPDKLESRLASTKGKKVAYSGSTDCFVENVIDGNLQAVMRFINLGFDVNYPHNDLKYGALHAASNFGHLRIMRVLISAGAEIDIRRPLILNRLTKCSYCETPLMMAAANGRIESLRILLAAGADKHLKDSQGRTSLDLAILYGKRETELFLLEPPGSTVAPHWCPFRSDFVSSRKGKITFRPPEENGGIMIDQFEFRWRQDEEIGGWYAPGNDDITRYETPEGAAQYGGDLRPPKCSTEISTTHPWHLYVVAGQYTDQAVDDVTRRREEAEAKRLKAIHDKNAKEEAEKAKKEQEKTQKIALAVGTIQCFFHCWKARKTVKAVKLLRKQERQDRRDRRNARKMEGLSSGSEWGSNDFTESDEEDKLEMARAKAALKAAQEDADKWDDDANEVKREKEIPEMGESIKDSPGTPHRSKRRKGRRRRKTRKSRKHKNTDSDSIKDDKNTKQKNSVNACNNDIHETKEQRYQRLFREDPQSNDLIRTTGPYIAPNVPPIDLPRGPQPEDLDIVATGLVKCKPAHRSVHRVRTSRLKRDFRETTYSFVLKMLPYTWYRAEVRAHNFHGFGSWSPQLVFRTPACEPEKPNSPFIVASTPTTIKFRWEVPRDNGSLIEAFSIQSQEEKYIKGKRVEGEWSNWRRLIVTLETEYLVQFLKPGRGYRFRVQARNRIAYGPFSDASEIMYTYKSLIISDLTPTSVTLSWETSDTSNIERYEMQQLDYNTDQWVKISDSLTQNFIKLRVLYPDTEYCFRVRWFTKETGWAPWEDCVAAEPFRTLKSAPMKMPKPTIFHKCYNQVTLTWKEPRNNGYLIDKYRVEIRHQSSKEWELVKELDQHEFKLCIPGLQRITAYSFRVSAKNKLGWGEPGSSTGAVLTCATSPPLQPYTDERKTDSLIVLKWMQPKWQFNVPIKFYTVEIKEKENGEWELMEGEIDGTSVLVDDLFPVLFYFFRVRCFTEYGWSAYSKVSKPIKTRRKL